MVGAACAAPDHGHLGPAEFVYIPDDMRPALADVFEAAAIEADPDISPELRTVARERSFNGPCLLALLVRIDADNGIVPESEQWLSAGAALQNVLLAIEELGYHAKVVGGGQNAQPGHAGGFPAGRPRTSVLLYRDRHGRGQNKGTPAPERRTGAQGLVWLSCLTVWWMRRMPA